MLELSSEGRIQMGSLGRRFHTVQAGLRSAGSMQQEEDRTTREGQRDCDAQGRGQRSEMRQRQAEPGRPDKKFKSNPKQEGSLEGTRERQHEKDFTF